MFFRRFLGFVLVAFLIVALLGGGAWAIQRSAWSQGYMMGRLSTEGQAGTAAPLVPFAYPGPYFGSSPFMGILGVMFAMGLFFLLFLVIAWLFRPRSWAMHGGPWAMGGGPWRHMGSPQEAQQAWHGHRPPPWCWDRPPEEAPGKPEANAGASNPQPAQQ